MPNISSILQDIPSPDPPRKAAPRIETVRETLSFSPPAFHPGIFVPEEKAPVDVSRAYPGLYASVRKIDPQDTQKATGLIRAGIYHLKDEFPLQQAHATRQLRTISYVLTGVRAEKGGKARIPGLPAGPEAYSDISVYEEPLGFLQALFHRFVRSWSTLDPRIAFEYWAACRFPFVHVAANKPIQSPGNHTSMWALSEAFRRYGWKT